jgi:hypothetical protein
MSMLSALLRLTLSAVLILNGVGTAVAGTRMHLEHARHIGHTSQPVAAQPMANAQAEPPCHHHGHDGVAPVSTPVEDRGVATNATEKSKTPAPDCCKSASCGCACMYATAGIVVTPLPHAVFNLHAAIAWTEASGHRPPSLPHLIRPPIG